MKNIFILFLTFFATTILAQDQVNLTFNVTHSGPAFVWNGPSDTVSDAPNVHPDYGANFVATGYIYPDGTFDTHGTNSGLLPNGDPEFPDLVIGKWRCQGWFIKNAIEALTNGGEWVVTSQIFDITDPSYGIGTLTTYGTERADFIQYDRTLTGGSGIYDGVVGQSTEAIVGFNVSEFENFVFTFDMKRKAQPAAKSVEPVMDPFINSGTLTKVGESTLIRKNDGLSATLKTSNLPYDYAMTFWWIIFNNPENCNGDCDAEDLFNPAVKADMRYASGQVTKGGNVTTFVDNITKGVASGSAFPAFQNALDAGAGGTFPQTLPAPSGLIDPHHAEIHLVVRSHGPAMPGQVSTQINSYEGGCNTYLDVLHFLDPTVDPIPNANGECGDIQFSVHK